MAARSVAVAMSVRWLELLRNSAAAVLIPGNGAPKPVQSVTLCNHIGQFVAAFVVTIGININCRTICKEPVQLDVRTDVCSYNNHLMNRRPNGRVFIPTTP